MICTSSVWPNDIQDDSTLNIYKARIQQLFRVQITSQGTTLENREK